jgi:heptosyltransferase-2
VVVIQGESIERVAAALRACDLFVSADSGIGHLAVACGVPSVQVLGPTNPDYIRPWGVAHQVVRRGTSCSPCFEYSKAPLRCQQAQPYRCLSGLGVNEVLAACLSLLGDQGATGRRRESSLAVRLPAGASGCALGLNAEARA